MDVLKINVRVKGCSAMESDETRVYMLMFDGTCEGAYFNGTILDGGVDTQVHNDALDIHTMSARYVMEGTDHEGKPCRIFVDNSASPRGEEKLITTPKIYTNSTALKWLETAKLQGELIAEGEKVTILVSTVE